MSKNAVKHQLERRALWAMVSYAVFRWESAAVIAITIVLTALYPRPFAWWPVWGWPALGLVSEVLIIATSLRDVQTAQQVVADMLRQRFNPGMLRSKRYRELMEQALTYRRRIEEVIRRQPASVLRERLESTTRGIDDWLSNIFRLARGLDAYTADTVIHDDMGTVPVALKNLEIRLQREDDPTVRAQLQVALEGRRTQWQTLQTLQNTMEKAEAQLESTLTALGTVYSQLVLIGAKDVEDSRTQRITESIRDEVAALQDIIEAMDEVYLGRGTKGNWGETREAEGSPVRGLGRGTGN